MFEGDLNRSGTWVHVGASNLAALQGIPATTDAGPAQANWTSTATNGVINRRHRTAGRHHHDRQRPGNPSSYWGDDAVRPLD